MCVGGTVDITVHEIQENHYLKELHKATGGGWGGNRVDENFTDFLKEIFNDGVWDEYVKKHPTELQNMMYNFSLQKCSASREAVYIRCYYNLTRVAESKKDISQFFTKAGAVWCDGTIMITYEKMKSLFDYSVNKIICALQEILCKPKMDKVQYILLVGGFASSIILRDAVREAFNSKYHILCPMEAQAAIAKGAVLFGVNPHIITSRISCRTYGLEVCEEFNDAVHDACKRRVSKDGDYIYCTGLFKKLVEIGESVDIHKASYYDFFPIEPDQTKVVFAFYCTKNQNAQYVDEEGMEQLGFCVVPSPDIRRGRNRRLKVEIKFGLTEFKARCTDVTSKESRTIVMDFLSYKYS